MTDRIKRELALVKSAYGEVDVDPDLRSFVIRRWPLVAGWNKQHTRLLVLVPPGYAVTAPDNFYTDADLRLAGGEMPGNASVVQQDGESWLQFSYHLEGGEWQPDKGHDFMTFLAGVARRLRETS
jgi:hypothetical protein